MKTVLGLVTCYNRKEKTVNAIRTLIEGNPNLEFSFLVADDNSTDGTKEALREFPQVMIVNGDGQLFYSGGMRLAIEKARSQETKFDYCLLFNDDVDFFAGAVEQLAQKSLDAIWVGPTCDTEGKLSYGGVVKTSKIRPSVQIIKGETPEGVLCDTFNANCVLIPWKIFCALDNIDPVYCHSMGDFDYAFAAARKGFAIRASSEFVGVCCDNPIEETWRDPKLSRRERLKRKESRKGLPRKEWFHYLRKNYNLVTAVVYSIVPYVRIMLKR